MFSREIDYDEELEEYQKGRCVYDKHFRKILFCPRDHLTAPKLRKDVKYSTSTSRTVSGMPN